MKVLIANPPFRVALDDKTERFFIRAGSRWPFSIVKKKNERAEYMPFPFYLAYTAALLEKEAEVTVVVEDSIALNKTKEEFLDSVIAARPDIILFESSTNSAHYDIDLCRRLKEINPNVKICLAGFHVTSLPKETFDISQGNVDFILLREYEFTFLELVKALKDGRDYGSLLGLAYQQNGEVVIHPAQDANTDVDSLPFPAWHLFPSNEVSDMTVYWDGFCQYKPAIQMHASRGCPFRCNFCAWTQLMYKNGAYRPRAVQNICDEIEQVVTKYHAREVYFDDDTFTGNKQHVLAFCEEVLRRGLHEKIRWSAMADFMITDSEMLYKMKEAGCIGLKFGVESGNKEVLQKVGKPINFEKLHENANLCSELHIKTHGTFTFGLSGDTKETMLETFELAKSLNCDSLQFSITTPFPGTRYYNELLHEGRLTSRNWEDYDGNNTSVVKFSDMDAEFISKFYCEATGKWLKYKLTKPDWVVRQLYNLGRTLYGQGFGVVIKRVKRFAELLKSAS